MRNSETALWIRTDEADFALKNVAALSQFLGQMPLTSGQPQWLQ